MEIILCLDNRGGMLFNNRRQSRDAEVIKDIINGLNGKKLVVTPYSAKLFEDFKEFIVVKDNLEEKTENTVVFNETECLKNVFRDINKITVYNWNRDYPADFVCHLDFTKFKLLSENDFKGKSHEKITKKIYVRCSNE